MSALSATCLLATPKFKRSAPQQEHIPSTAHPSLSAYPYSHHAALTTTNPKATSRTQGSRHQKRPARIILHARQTPIVNCSLYRDLCHASALRAAADRENQKTAECRQVMEDGRRKTKEGKDAKVRKRERRKEGRREIRLFLLLRPDPLLGFVDCGFVRCGAGGGCAEKER